jgi:CRISPR-associated protein Csd1
MILQALNHYYERLESDATSEIAPFGYSQQKISFCVVLNLDGTLHQIIAETDGNTERPRPKSLIVPGGAKPSGAGINPCFLWDNTGYLLGYKPDDDKPQRTAEAFLGFRAKHLALRSVIPDPEFEAVCAFLESWKPENAVEFETLRGITTGFGVFRIRGAAHYVHDQAAVRAWWDARLANSGTDTDTAPVGQCLITGRQAKLARLHEPKIKGVSNAQSSGAALVSFNDKAYESFMREQSFNAPVSEAAAFQYCTALNHLLRQGGNKLQIDESTTVVYWTESPSQMEEFFRFLADPIDLPPEDEALKQKVHVTLKRIAEGRAAEDLELGCGETAFYVLGLSPNQARLSIRFWYVSTLNAMVSALQEHFRDLSMIRGSDRDPEFPSIRQLLEQTVRDRKDIPPLLGGAVMRAIITGSAYPQMLFSAVLRRIRADHVINCVRAGILKASLNRNSRLGIHPLQQEISMSLDPTRPEAAYQLGRLFAELEKAQEDALPAISATIKDRYFGGASATPASVFPRIIRGSQHHLGKLEYRAKIHREKQIQEICGRLDGFPTHLNLTDQGLFALGYYHQRQAIFTKKSAADEQAADP